MTLLAQVPRERARQDDAARHPAARGRQPAAAAAGGAAGAAREHRGHAQQHRHDRHPGGQLRRPRGHRAGRARDRAAREARRAARPIEITEDTVSEHLGTQGRPGPGPAHPDQRRDAHQQLLPLAARVHRDVRHRDAVAGLPRAGVLPGPGVLPAAAATIRSHRRRRSSASGCARCRATLLRTRLAHRRHRAARALADRRVPVGAAVRRLHHGGGRDRPARVRRHGVSRRSPARVGASSVFGLLVAASVVDAARSPGRARRCRPPSSAGWCSRSCATTTCARRQSASASCSSASSTSASSSRTSRCCASSRRAGAGCSSRSTPPWARIRAVLRRAGLRAPQAHARREPEQDRRGRARRARRRRAHRR